LSASPDVPNLALLVVLDEWKCDDECLRSWLGWGCRGYLFEKGDFAVTTISYFSLLFVCGCLLAFACTEVIMIEKGQLPFVRPFLFGSL